MKPKREIKFRARLKIINKISYKNIKQHISCFRSRKKYSIKKIIKFNECQILSIEYVRQHFSYILTIRYVKPVIGNRMSSHLFITHSGFSWMKKCCCLHKCLHFRSFWPWTIICFSKLSAMQLFIFLSCFGWNQEILRIINHQNKVIHFLSNNLLDNIIQLGQEPTPLQHSTDQWVFLHPQVCDIYFNIWKKSLERKCFSFSILFSQKNVESVIKILLWLVFLTVYNWRCGIIFMLNKYSRCQLVWSEFI